MNEISLTSKSLLLSACHGWLPIVGSIALCMGTVNFLSRPLPAADSASGAAAVAVPDLGTPPRPAAAGVTVSPASTAAGPEEPQARQARQADTGIRQLSVEPGTLPLLPADRPAWIEAAPDYSSSIHRLVVASLVAEDPNEVDSMLDEALELAVHEYFEQQVLPLPVWLEHRITADFIRKNMIEDPTGYTAELNTSAGPLYQKWVRVSITPQQRELILSWHREGVQRKRLTPLGLGLAAALGFVGLSHLVLRRIDSRKATDFTFTQPSEPPRPAGDGHFVAAAGNRPQAAPRQRRWWRVGLLVPALLALAIISVVLSLVSVRSQPRGIRAREIRVEDMQGIHVLQENVLLPDPYQPAAPHVVEIYYE